MIALLLLPFAVEQRAHATLDPSTGTPEAIPGDETRFVDPDYGFGVPYGAPWTATSGDGGAFALTNGTSTVTFTGSSAYADDAAACLTAETATAKAGDSATPGAVQVDGGEKLTRDGVSATIQFDQDGQIVTRYIECRALTVNGTLLITWETPADLVAAETPAVMALVNRVELPTFVTIEIIDFIYVADPMLQIPVGTTVVWINRDASPHTVTADDESFDTGLLARDDRFSMTFDQPGEYPYFCVYHPYMTGAISVSTGA